MLKYSFYNDYSEGAHQNIFDALIKTNLTQDAGYGYDEVSNEARKRILELCKTDSDVYFVSGGTQANLIAISAMLRSFECVLCANTGHINVHEAGAIEATGHKVESIMTNDGKITPEVIDPLLKEREDEHMVKPKAVYISNATEVGTVYTKSELEALSDYCKSNGLYLFLDGARLGSALMAEGNDLTIEIIAKNTDIFYIGGTKNGAMLGESLVITHQEIKKDFVRNIKQRGAMLAKGRLLGTQFNELFKNNLYFDLALHANQMATKLTQGMSGMGVKFLTESKTNQIFPILSNEKIQKLGEMYGFYVWSKVDENNSAIRLVTSWATPQSAVELFLDDLKKLN